MRKRRSTITQQFSPTFRKKISTNYLSLSLPGAYANLQNNHNCNNQNEPQESKQKQSHFSIILQSSSGQRSIDKKRMERVQQNYQNFIQNYNKIYQIIDSVDEAMRMRMEAHEQSLLTVIKSQIEKMQQQCKNIIEQYNSMIRNKNKDQQIYYLKNQLDYFRYEALYHFQNNKKIAQQNKDLKQLIKNKDSIINDLNQIIKKKTIKIFKQRMLTEKMSQKLEKLNEYSNMNKESQTQRQKLYSLKDNQNESQFLLTKMKRIARGKPIQNTTLPKSQVKNDVLSSKNFRTIMDFNCNSTIKQKQKKDQNKGKKNWFLQLNFSKKRIKTDMEAKSQRQQKSYQQVNGVKIINKLSIKGQGKSKSLWKFQGKVQL